MEQLELERADFVERLVRNSIEPPVEFRSDIVAEFVAVAEQPLAVLVEECSDIAAVVVAALAEEHSDIVVAARVELVEEHSDIAAVPAAVAVALVVESAEPVLVGKAVVECAVVVVDCANLVDAGSVLVADAGIELVAHVGTVVVAVDDGTVDVVQLPDAVDRHRAVHLDSNRSACSDVVATEHKEQTKISISMSLLLTDLELCTYPSLSNHLLNFSLSSSFEFYILFVSELWLFVDSFPSEKYPKFCN